MKYIFLALFIFNSLCAIPFTEDLLEPGHSVYLTESADETHEWKLRLIEEANSSLEISAGYVMGQVFDEMLQAIFLKLQGNSEIKINILMLEVADFIRKDHQILLSNMRELFPKQFNFCISGSTDALSQDGKTYFSENHTKIIIVDEKYVLIGGTNLVDYLSTADVNKYPPIENLSSKFLPRASSDMDTIVSGPMASKLRKEFFRLFNLYIHQEPLNEKFGEFTNETSFFPIDEESKANIAFFDENSETAHDIKAYAIIAGPRINLHSIGNMYEHLIDNATTSIDIGNMYFFPRKSIYDAMLNAVNRNVAFSIITNGPHEELTTSNSTRSLYAYINRLNYFPIISGKNFSYWELFLAKDVTQKNVNLHEFAIPGTLYHKKVMAVDDRYTVIGSYNLGMKSEDAAHEVAMVIDSEIITAKLKKILVEDQANSTNVSFNQALGWYFDPYYLLIELFERKISDGILL